ncbi:uncharacterized protein LOC129620872 isoform X2 [Bubalus kerabau]|uniref:uncharacterized protein LOC129620872 isoform X2 n=1 Tax=Bubalus carabanensis TaxID=3119969 RepID=UPI00244EEB7C|nr:uncharacterized protein LOC129620872 isoform X2 [Bubalus carabanensis]
MAGLVVSGTQVSYIGQDCREIPEHLGRDCGHFAKRLDLSFNLLRKLLERKRERTSRAPTGEQGEKVKTDVLGKKTRFPAKTGRWCWLSGLFRNSKKSADILKGGERGR